MLKFAARLINSVLGGVFLACAVIVAAALLSSGASAIGFTLVTYWYYAICLAACAGLIVRFEAARGQAKLMGLFPVALILVIGVGFNSFAGEAAGGSQVDQMQAMLSGLAIVLAKGVMYLAPGLLTAVYAGQAYLQPNSH